MRYNIVGYLLSEGFKSVFKQKKMTSASIIIMCLTMIIFGIFFLIGENINYAMKQIESQQGMKVILKDTVTEKQKENLEKDINAISGVNKVKYVSKEEAIATVKVWLGNRQDILIGYDEGENNPFPASFFVTLTNLEKNNEVQNKIKNLEGVEEITSENNTIANLSKIAKMIKRGTFGILVLLIIISIFIISYTIKLTVYARRREISIMKYVGATNSFIRGPFVIEGVIIGVVSALITIVIVGFCYNAILGKMLTSSVTQLLTLSLYTFSELFMNLLVIYLLLGIGIGIAGSMISMKKYLQV